MNFEDIKQKMNSENMDETHIPEKIQNLQSSKMPIEKVRKTMRSEIITQLIAIVFFFVVPIVLPMHPLAQSVYYILMFVTSIMTMGYLAKMIWFLNKTRDMNLGGRDTVLNFIHDLKITLEVYKTAIIAGSLLLPLSMLALVLGIDKFDESLFMNFILLNASAGIILLFILAYLAITVFIYYITVAWADGLYGIHIKELEKTLLQFEN